MKDKASFPYSCNSPRPVLDRWRPRSISTECFHMIVMIWTLPIFNHYSAKCPMQKQAHIAMLYWYQTTSCAVLSSVTPLIREATFPYRELRHNNWWQIVDGLATLEKVEPSPTSLRIGEWQTTWEKTCFHIETIVHDPPPILLVQGLQPQEYAKSSFYISSTCIYKALPVQAL